MHTRLKTFHPSRTFVAFSAITLASWMVPAGICGESYVGCEAGNSFAAEVWPKVGARDCVKCHKAGGDAEDSKFILRDLTKVPASDQSAAMSANREAFSKMARVMDGNDSRLLLKASGKLDHEGETVLMPDSAGYRILADFVRSVNSPKGATPPSSFVEEVNAAPFFEGVLMLDDRRLLRRVTLSLAGRLPTEAETAAVSAQGLKSLSAVLDAVMKEDAFYERLREAFNDVFLTIGLDDNAENVLTYDHFEKTRLWYQKYDLSHITDEKERTKAGYKLADDYRKAIQGEPMRLIEYIVRNERPFTEVVTADYIMVTPYSARGYGVFDELKSTFKNADDPFEYVPVKIKALIGRDKRDNQDSATGFYPHAGLLSTFQYYLGD